MTKKKIVLVSLYDLDSLSVYTLRAVLQEAGYDVHCVFFKNINLLNNTCSVATQREIELFAEHVKELDPLFVGLSIRSTFFKLSCDLTDAVNKISDIPVVWGGIHPTVNPEDSIRHADAICVGEGEGAVVELAQRLESGESYDDIKNLWVRRGDEIIRNDLRPLVADLDSVPFPDFSTDNTSFIENDHVQPMPDMSGRNYFWCMTSRGCPFGCTFCCNNHLRRIYKGKGKYVRRRSVENVLAELEKAKADLPNLKIITFMDDVFLFDLDWLKKFCAEYKERIGLEFFCFTHPKTTTEEMVATIKEAGVGYVTMGIQSGSERVRNDYYKRRDKNDEIVRGAKILHKYGINTSYDVIMDNPLEKLPDKRETLGLLLELPRPFTLHLPSLTNFPGSELTEMLLERELITDEDVEDRQEKSYTRWSPMLDLARAKEDQFFDCLYYMTQIRYFPRPLIRLISRLDFLRRNPSPLITVMRLISINKYTVRRDCPSDLKRLEFVRNLRAFFRNLVRKPLPEHKRYRQ